MKNRGNPFPGVRSAVFMAKGQPCPPALPPHSSAFGDVVPGSSSLMHALLLHPCTPLPVPKLTSLFPRPPVSVLDIGNPTPWPHWVSPVSPPRLPGRYVDQPVVLSRETRSDAEFEFSPEAHEPHVTFAVGDSGVSCLPCRYDGNPFLHFKERST